MEIQQAQNDQVDRTNDVPCTPSNYVAPKMEKMQKLAEVTGEMKMTGGDAQQPV